MGRRGCRGFKSPRGHFEIMELLVLGKSRVRREYGLFEAIEFTECNGCSLCCHMPWLLTEEYNSNKDKFKGGIKQIDSVSFIMDQTRCKYAVNDRCEVYQDRPLDCRLFPLDIIEDGGKYWWCIFTTCPQNIAIRKKLIPLIPKIEEILTAEMFEQYRGQIEVSKEVYLPYKNKQYELVRLFGENVNFSF